MLPCHVYPRIVHGETILTELSCFNADFTGALNMFGGSDATAHYYMLHNHQQLRQVACPSSSIVHMFVLSLKLWQGGIGKNAPEDCVWTFCVQVCADQGRHKSAERLLSHVIRFSDARVVVHFLCKVFLL